MFEIEANQLMSTVLSMILLRCRNDTIPTGLYSNYNLPINWYCTIHASATSILQQWIEFWSSDHTKRSRKQRKKVTFPYVIMYSKKKV